jgi:hypothetical protein
MLIYNVLDRKFLIANAKIDNKPIIYCNDSFCEAVKFTRAEIMQKSCICEFLYGSLTSETAIFQLKQALTRTSETQVIILMKKKDGSVFSENFKIKT